MHHSDIEHPSPMFCSMEDLTSLAAVKREKGETQGRSVIVLTYSVDLKRID